MSNKNKVKNPRVITAVFKLEIKKLKGLSLKQINERLDFSLKCIRSDIDRAIKPYVEKE